MKGNNADKAVENLWLRLQGILITFAEEAAVNDPSLVSDIGRRANDAFPLFAYLAFRRSENGGEVAVTIDVQSADKQITIESGVSLDDGEIICLGPSTSVAALADMINLENSIDVWMGEFQRWLVENADVIRTRTSQLH